MINMQKIKNYRELTTEKGDLKARRKVLQLMDAVLQEVDAGRRIAEIMRLDGDILKVGVREWDLRQKRNIYLLGAGKACNAMAEAVCDIMGDRLTKGIISVKIREEQDRYCHTDVYVGGHPIPNAEGMAAAEAMIDLIVQAGPDDLFISVTSGGSSALLTDPVEGITLEEEMLAQDMLLKSGAKILEINAVRRHISRTNGGRLAEMICNEKGAELISLMVGDAVGSPATKDRRIPGTFYGTMFAADRTTIQDARDMIENYDLSATLPQSIVSYINNDALVKETPKEFGDKLTTFILGSLADSCAAAEVEAEKMGVPLCVLTTYLEGESREAGYFLASIAKEVKLLQRPVQPPCFLVCAGETTTNITEPPQGIGGPSQELVLGFSIGVKGMEGIAAASIDTEGTDGPTIYAGGIADGSTYNALEKAGVNIYQALRTHAAGDALKKIGDNIFTGNTGTNLCDFNVIYVE